jgi:hypothetical protein
VYEILSNPTNLLGAIGAIIDFSWAFLTGYIIPTLNNFWSALYLGAQAVALFTPPTLVVKLGIVTAVASFGIIGLRSEGCLPV